MSSKCFIAAITACATMFGASSASAADAYPNAPIRIVVPFPPGGSSDLVARVLAKNLADSLGQPVVIDNRGGGGTTIGTQIVAKSKPDGYTLAWLVAPSAINVTLRAHMPFDIERDFIPISTVASIPLVLMVKSSIPVNNLAELVAYAKARPGKLTYGSSGPGGTPHLAGELLKSTMAIDMIHVPYQGSAPVLNAMMGGYVDVVIEAVQSSAPVIASGKAKAFATTGVTRSSLFPNLPTFSELGYPNYQLFTWFGLAAPAGTPAPIIERLNQEVVKVLQLPAVKRSLEEQGFQLIGDTPKESAAFLRNEIVKWGAIVTASGARESE